MSQNSFKIIHENDFGWRAIIDGRTVFVRAASLTKEGVFLTDEEIFLFSKRIQEYLDNIDGLSFSNYNFTKVFSDKNFSPYRQKYGYKFMKISDYEEYVKKGNFLVSSLGRFRSLEGQGDPAGDRFEGALFGTYRSGNREINTVTLSGFDSYIFSCARTLENKRYMQEKFGEVALRIDLYPFARALEQILKPKSYYICNIQYVDLKIYRGVIPNMEFSKDKFEFNRDFVKFIDIKSRLPSIFSKPMRFKLEKEVRISYKMKSDVLNLKEISSSNLLKFVRSIE